MMDWTGTSQKAKRDQHLSHVSIGHVVPNEVPPLVRSFDEQAVSRFCVCSAAAAYCSVISNPRGRQLLLRRRMQSMAALSPPFSYLLGAIRCALFLLDCRRPPRCTTSTHGGDTGATDDVEWSAIGDSFVPQFFTALSSDHGPPLAERKVRTGQRICASWSGLDLASLNHIKPRQYGLAMAKPRTRLDVSQQGYCVSAKATSFSSCRSSSLPSSLS